MERKWLIHDGNSIPVPIGAFVEVQRLNGSFDCYIAGRSHRPLTGDVVPLTQWRADRPNAWLWGTLTELHRPFAIVRYRLHDTPESEAERRAERMTEFKKALRSAAPLVRGKVGV
jgi:hypothetical protein